MKNPGRPSARCRALLVEVSKYLDGDLTPSRRRIVERHLKSCACCETMEDCLRKTIAVCRAEGKTRLPRDVRSRAAARIRALLSETRR
jgi:anti-sigma factor RsiW